MAPADLPESDPTPVPGKRIRLQRYLASCGLGSRRACEEFITAGRVTIDGEIVTELGVQIDPQRNKVALDGEKLKMERKKYYVFYKPPGVLCTNRDPEGRPRVIDFFPKDGPRLFTVGRLDEDSEGLLIVTNDGDLAQKLAHPSFRIFRTYHVLVAGHPTPETLQELRKGVYFEEGRFRVEGVKSIKRQGQSAWCEVVLAEGHNREVRRLFARVGHKVMKLQRVAFGPIFLGKMTRGEIRELRRDELERLLGMLMRNDGERIQKGSEPSRSGAAKRGSSPSRSKKQNDGDLLNRTSRKVPPARRTGPASTGAGSASRTGKTSPERRPGQPFDKRPATKPPRASEPRGLGLREVSDEELMGIRPEASSSSPRKSAASPSTDRGRSGPKRDDRRATPHRTPKGSDDRRPKGRGTSGRSPRGDGPTESFGRRSPGQPKAKGPKGKPRRR